MISRSRATLGALVVSFLALALGALALESRGPWGADEERQLELARELHAAPTIRNVMVPRRNGVPYAGEPPLAPCLAALTARAVGRFDAGVARIPSLVATAFVIAATFFLGLRLIGGDGALRAVVVLCGLGGFLAQSVTAGVDALLAAFTAIGLALLFVGAFPAKASELRAAPDVAAAPTFARSVRRRLVAFGLFVLVLGMLANGPETLLVPLSVLGVFCALGRVRPRLGAGWLGLPVGLGVLAVWIVGGTLLGGLSFGASEVREALTRFTSPYGPTTSAPRLALETLVALLPFAPLLLPAAYDAVRSEWHGYRFGVPAVDRLPTLVPLTWFVATFALFELSPARRLSDVVAAFPAVALLIGWYYDRPEGASSAFAMKLEKVSAAVVIALGALALPAVEVWKHHLGVRGGLSWELIPAALVMTGSGVLRWRRSRLGLPVLAFASLCAFGVVHLRLVPALDAVLSARSGATALLADVDEGVELGVVAEGEPPDGFLFAARRTFPSVPPEEVPAWLAGGRRVVLSASPREGLAVVASASVGGRRMFLLGEK